MSYGYINYLSLIFKIYEINISFEKYVFEAVIHDRSLKVT